MGGRPERTARISRLSVRIGSAEPLSLHMSTLRRHPTPKMGVRELHRQPALQTPGVHDDDVAGKGVAGGGAQDRPGRRRGALRGLSGGGGGSGCLGSSIGCVRAGIGASDEARGVAAGYHEAMTKSTVIANALQLPGREPPFTRCDGLQVGSVLD